MRVLNKLMNEIFLLIQDNFNLSSIPTAPFFTSPAQASITQWFVFVVEITIPYRSSHQWMKWNIEKPRKIIVKETLEQVFSCEFCEISKNTFFTEHVWATAFSLNNFRPPFVVVMNFMLAILLISVLCHVKSDVICHALWSFMFSVTLHSLIKEEQTTVKNTNCLFHLREAEIVEIILLCIFKNNFKNNCSFKTFNIIN